MRTPLRAWYSTAATSMRSRNTRKGLSNEAEQVVQPLRPVDAALGDDPDVDEQVGDAGRGRRCGRGSRPTCRRPSTGPPPRWPCRARWRSRWHPLELRTRRSDDRMASGSAWNAIVDRDVRRQGNTRQTPSGGERLRPPRGRYLGRAGRADDLAPAAGAARMRASRCRATAAMTHRRPAASRATTAARPSLAEPRQ